MSWSTSELKVRLALLNQFKPSSKIFYWPFQGGTSFVDLLWFCSVLCLLCLCESLFICALWSPAGKGLTSWLWFVVSNCEFVTFPLVSWVRCDTWLYRFLIFAPLLTLRTLIDIARLAKQFNMRSQSWAWETWYQKTGTWYSIYQFTSRFTVQTSDYDVIIDFRVDSMSLTTSFKKCNIMMTW